MNQAVAQLAERYWDTLMEANPTWATLIGDHRFDDQMEDLTREAEDAQIGALGAIASEAAAIDSTGLDPQDRVTRSSIMEEAASNADMMRSRNSEYLVDQQIGIHINVMTYMRMLTPSTAEHADAYVDKASRIGTTFDHAIERLRQGVASGRTPPRVAVEKTISQIDDYLSRPVDQDGLMQLAPPDSMKEDAVTAWRAAMAEQVEQSVRPGFARYRDALAAEILTVARPPEESGVCWLPDGEEVYARAMRHYTTLDLTPEAVHQSGRDEIGELDSEYRRLGEKVLGTGDLAEIYTRLRDDPSLRFETSDQVREHAEQAMARANAATPEWFGRLPKTPCIVKAIPEIGAEDAPLAYYMPPAGDGSRPGVFFINISKPEIRTRYESEALAFHEGVPGHHFQLAIAQELEGLPMFRRNSLQTAYVEGWGLYTERLGDEMGLYSGDVERMGILSFDSWRAGRLVVDTGIHAMGWSRQQAIDYLTENSPQPEKNIENEVDRYIGYTGQALAYKIGQREILRLRENAKQRLGTSFDIRAFHDTVLEVGPVTLPVLGEVVDDWVTAAST